MTIHLLNLGHYRQSTITCKRYLFPVNMIKIYFKS